LNIVTLLDDSVSLLKHVTFRR